jgi:hypothetical protein
LDASDSDFPNPERIPLSEFFSTADCFLDSDSVFPIPAADPVSDTFSFDCVTGFGDRNPFPSGLSPGRDCDDWFDSCPEADASLAASDFLSESPTAPIGLNPTGFNAPRPFNNPPAGAMAPFGAGTGFRAGISASDPVSLPDFRGPGEPDSNNPDALDPAPESFTFGLADDVPLTGLAGGDSPSFKETDKFSTPLSSLMERRLQAV